MKGTTAQSCFQLRQLLPKILQHVYTLALLLLIAICTLRHGMLMFEVFLTIDMDLQSAACQAVTDLDLLIMLLQGSTLLWSQD